MSNQFNQAVHGVKEEDTKHRKKKHKCKKNFLIEWKSNFFYKEEGWSILKAYATEEQRDKAFDQMHKNYVSEISEIRKANREEVNTCD